MEKTLEQLIQEFRHAFKQLPATSQKSEANRLHRIVERKPVFHIEDGQSTFRLYTAKGIMKFLRDHGVTNPDRANVDKAMKGQRKSLYGFNIYVIQEAVEDLL